MAEAAADLSNGLAAAVEAVGPSLVRVEGRHRAASGGVVWSAEGVVVTAHHVLERDEGIEVLLEDGRSLLASVAGRDPSTDLAALRVPASGLAVPTWREPDALKVGHLVLAVSRTARSTRARLGVVSALGEDWRTPAGGRIDRYIETDLGPYPGFSGSLLVDVAGRAVGLATSGLRRGSSLAVPATTLRRVIPSLLSRGGTRRGFLGVGLSPVRLPTGLSATLGQDAGLIVLSVEADSPASQAGILLGDVLVSLDGRPVSHVGDLLPFLDEERVGTAVAARVLRAGALQEAGITVGERGSRS